MGYAAEFKEEVEEELFRYERDLFSIELGEERYIVCLNPGEEKRDREKREQIVCDLEGVAHRCFMAAGVKPPPLISQM